LKKDLSHQAGKDLQKPTAIPSSARGDQRFTAMVASFLTKHPNGFNADQAKALQPR